MDMEKYALTGHPLGHTMSPFIHSRLFELSQRNALYSVCDCPPESFDNCFKSNLRNINGFNVTIPYKQTVIPLLDRLDSDAEFYGAVNCVACGEHAVGYNTDAYGFCAALDSAGISLEGSVLVLGNGGAARTVAFEAARRGCKVTIASRSDKGQVLAKELERRLGCEIEVLRFSQIIGGYDLVVNATPVGMFPHTYECVLEKEQLRGSKALMDLIYNPQQTVLVKYANELGMKVAQGMEMLVWQAARAHEIWYGASFEPEKISEVVVDANAYMERHFGSKKDAPVVLLGFMGCGKSTVGSALAERLVWDFVDTDELIVKQEGMSIPQIFDERGEAGFREAEHRACLKAAQLRRTVIATGGGAMTFERNISAFADCTKIHLSIPFSLARERVGNDKSRPLFGSDAENLYNNRLPLYQKAADLTVDASQSVDTISERIMKIL